MDLGKKSSYNYPYDYSFPIGFRLPKALKPKGQPKGTTAQKKRKLAKAKENYERKQKLLIDTVNIMNKILSDTSFIFPVISYSLKIGTCMLKENCRLGLEELDMVQEYLSLEVRNIIGCMHCVRFHFIIFLFFHSNNLAKNTN